MSEKIYCKDCRFYAKTIGTCHRNPPLPMFDIKNNATGHPFVFDNDWCGMAERKEEAGAEFVTVGNVEADDAVSFTSYRDIGKMQAENKNLRGLITEIREFLIGGAIPGHVHLKQECIREIYTIASEQAKN